MEMITPRLKITRSPLTGKLEAAYIYLRNGTVYDTREADEAGNAYADYDENGVLLGIELLGPCEVQVFDKIAMDANLPFTDLAQYAPHGLVAA